MPLFGPQLGSGQFGGSPVMPQFIQPMTNIGPSQGIAQSAGAPPKDVGGLRTAADFQESTRPGVADPTWGNIGAALQNAVGTMTGPIAMGAATAANQLTGLGEYRKKDTFLGKLVDALAPSGFKSAGARPLDPDILATVHDQISKAKAYAAQDARDRERGMRNATDSHGQVKGGGYGGIGGGITAGGPR